MPSTRVLHLLDAALALWVLAWIALGVAIGINVGNLTGLSHTVVAEGRAVETVGSAMHTFGSVPLVGSEVGAAATQVQQAGASAVASGTSSAAAIERLSVLLAIAVALLPSVPVFGIYLPARLRRVRETRALARAVRAHAADPEFHAYLARRAIQSLDYDTLRRVSPAPSAEAADGACAALAAAELRRLGIDPRVLRRQRTRA